MIKAYAGVAKTTTLVMLSKELPNLPNFTLALAFNKSTRIELESRMPTHINVSTLNAEGLRAWKRTIRVNTTLDENKISKLTEQAIRYCLPPRGPRGAAAPGSNASSAAVRAGNVPRAFADLAPPERDGVLSLIAAARNRRLIPSFFMDAGIIPDTPSSWAKLAADCALPAPGPELIHLARQMLIDRAALPPGPAEQPGVPVGGLQAEVVKLVKSARIKGLVPSYFTAHKGLISDEEEVWAELALGCDIEPDTWKLVLARKVLVR
eukprot:CAMPEP_0172160514 /NCGR_PEP_ID=MMETSP1050-20130122/5596_1 /TAXON_ID=233186 /ORGANISM="Cryptomonas curvata, Strain CCAP979/52" /LENGTH=264 /DNA_ID=CAMNT_0012830277 /DNA_START=667 /DNA_END=1458 /DNA_ORIENTATION=+